MKDKLYEILATLHYNSERREPLESILANFLVSKDPRLDIEMEARRLFNKKDKQMQQIHRKYQQKDYLNSEQFIADWFKQESLLLSNVSRNYLPEYIMEKFAPYEDEFRRKNGFDFGSLWLFSFKFMEYFAFKQIQTGFADEVYAFKSKKEYADLGFVKIPSPVYIEQWKNVITVNKSELRRLLFGSISSSDLDKVVDILSLNADRIPSNSKDIHFPSTPFLQTKEDLILPTPSYLGRSLHTIYESLFRKCQSYLDSKGTTFEKIALDLFRQTPTKLLAFKVKYGKNNQFEADAIVSYERSLWVVEASSHILSKGAFQGDLFHVRKDLNRTLRKCFTQGIRALSNISTVSLPSPYNNLNKKGIIIVVDGVYPNLNLESFGDPTHNNMPVYVINYFDLRTLIDQPEIDQVEEFLLWRTQKPMPVICFDEKDYWNFYFDRYKRLNDIRATFKQLQEKGVLLIYDGYRFNRKGYLARIRRE